jgi:hypothetical protein
MYDIIFVTNTDYKTNKQWKKLKERFPLAKFAKDFDDARKKSFTKFFWIVWDDLNIADNFDFSYKPDIGSQDTIHVFKNSEWYDGVCLFPKNINVSLKEVTHRFFIHKKEIDIVASNPIPFEVYNLSSYDDYLEAVNNCETPMFWVVWNDVNVLTEFNFDKYIPYYDTFHRNITHIYKNGDFYDGICLFSKTSTVTKREFEYRFFNNKKEIDIVASTPKPFDIVFISYNEPFAQKNFDNLYNRFGNTHKIYHVAGVKGIHQAHKAAAELVSSDMFWVVDADAIILDDFYFDFPQVVKHDTYTQTTVHVWRSKNPVNDLIYGYGGVKLFPKKLTLEMDMTKPDMTTSISTAFKIMPILSNVTEFNTDPFTTWRSAFRECVKLSSSIIDRQNSAETLSRLDVWCSVGEDKPYGNFAIAGANAGRNYGFDNKDDTEQLRKINNYDWLYDQFLKCK